MIVQLDTENADLDLTSQIAVLTDTPDAANPAQCQGLIFLGDGAKDLDGTGGNFELTIEMDSQTLEPDPEVVAVSTGQTRAALKTVPFVVPANVAVVVKVKSPNGADTDVDVTAYLYDVAPANVASGIVEANVKQVSDDATAADDLELFIEALGTDDMVLISADAQDLSATLDVNTKTITAAAIAAAAFAAGAIDAAALNADAVDLILDEIVEGTYSVREALRLILAFACGKASGGGTTTVTFRDTGDATDRIIATVDANGNRTAVTLDET